MFRATAAEGPPDIITRRKKEEDFGVGRDHNLPGWNLQTQEKRKDVQMKSPRLAASIWESRKKQRREEERGYPTFSRGPCNS